MPDRARIMAFFRSRGLSEADAEDAAQDTLIKAFRNREALRTPEAARAWCWRIAANVLTDHSRKPHRKRELAATGGGDPEDPDGGTDWLANLPDNTESPEASVLNVELMELFVEAVQTLSRENQTIVMLRVFEDMPHAEIARLLGKTEAAVKMAASRAFNRLRAALPDESDE